MQLFYVREISEDVVQLNQEESKHALKVLRLSKGDPIQIVDGKGGFYEAEILDDNIKGCKLAILKSLKDFGKRDFKLHIGIAPTKNIDRFEWFLEKATEIGIDEITPVLCEHSERKVIKPERLNKILVSAMKQSVKAYLPVLNEISNYNELVANTTFENKYIAHCYEGEKKHLKAEIKKGENVLILIGPEGDFSPQEIELAKVNGFKEISLGTSRLRTETAGIVACNIVNLANE